MASESSGAADYIKHHLQSLTSLNDVSEGQGLQNIADFSFINLDAIFFAIVLGVVGSFLLWRAPGRRLLGCQAVFRLPSNFCMSLSMICAKASSTMSSRAKW